MMWFALKGYREPPSLPDYCHADMAAVAERTDSSIRGVLRDRLAGFAPSALSHGDKVVRAHRQADGDHDAPHLLGIGFLRVVRTEPAT